MRAPAPFREPQHGRRVPLTAIDKAGAGIAKWLPKITQEWPVREGHWAVMLAMQGTYAPRQRQGLSRRLSLVPCLLSWSEYSKGGEMRSKVALLAVGGLLLIAGTVHVLAVNVY